MEEVSGDENEPPNDGVEQQEITDLNDKIFTGVSSKYLEFFNVVEIIANPDALSKKLMFKVQCKLSPKVLTDKSQQKCICMTVSKQSTFPLRRHLVGFILLFSE